ncbi:MAG: CDP-alcohol phosphatidyltransferase family protein [Lachnospiraceae bacterium]|nr:CDP-alcohol phosphatidyltransferase family protein [Lachnospiraceae bacterium]
MIGFYDYTVVLTYLSLACSVIGMFCASEMNLRWAIFCLAVSGLCDMFDGKIARTKKNRTEDEKNFGIQIDSLCDVVCFGIFPIIICYKIGMNHMYSMVILVLYGLAGVIRLGYFNVMEAKRQNETDEARKYYQGLPITSMAIALPILFVFSPLFPSHELFLAALHVVVAAVGILFVTNFKLRKLSTKELFLLVGVVAAAVAVIVFVWRGWWMFLHSLK